MSAPGTFDKIRDGYTRVKGTIVTIKTTVASFTNTCLALNFAKLSVNGLLNSCRILHCRLSP